MGFKKTSKTNGKKAKHDNDNQDDQLNDIQDDLEDEYNSDDAINSLNKSSNNKKKNQSRNNQHSSNYRSLQKSKRSIKTIEKTLKNSKSIEKWLNEYDEQNNTSTNLNQSSMTATTTTTTATIVTTTTTHVVASNSVSSSVVPPDTIVEEDKNSTSKSEGLLVFPNESLDSLFQGQFSDSSVSSKEEKLTAALAKEMPIKLVQRLDKMLALNRLDGVRVAEAEMARFVRELIMPKSLVNLEDITFLKWLLTENNFKLYVQQPILGTIFFPI